MGARTRFAGRGGRERIGGTRGEKLTEQLQGEDVLKPGPHSSRARPTFAPEAGGQYGSRDATKTANRRTKVAHPGRSTRSCLEENELKPGGRAEHPAPGYTASERGVRYRMASDVLRRVQARAVVSCVRCCTGACG